MPRPHRVDPSTSRTMAMPIFTYLAVAGSVLIASLFVADAMREKDTPAVVTKNPQMQSLATALAPAPEAQPEVLAKVEPTAQAEWAEEPPKKTGTGDRTTLGREAEISVSGKLRRCNFCLNG